jgi:hypothetical protein
MAYSLNGTSQYFTVSSAPVAVVPITMACWFNSNNTTSNQRLIGLFNSTDNSRPYFDINARGADAGDPIAISIFNGFSLQTTPTTTGYSSNTWHHACGVFASATSRTIYLDAAGNQTGTTDIQPSGVNSTRIGVFAGSGGALSGYLDGLIAEVGIWNVALTASEIAALAKGMTCDKVRPQSLVFYAPLVRDLQDVKGGLTITNNNTATVATHPRVYA